MLELLVYQDAAAFDELKSEWNSLLARAPMNCIFYTWEWQSTWWDAYRPGELLILACREDGQLLGIAPLFITESERGRAAQIIGCVDVTDYLDFIIDADRLQDVLTAFADYFADHRGSFDLLDFCNIPQHSPTQSILPALLEMRGFDASVTQQEVCPIIELPQNWSGYLGSLDKKQRHEVRRKMRRIHGAASPIDWYIVNGSHHLPQETDQFMRLMAASDPQKEQFLQNVSNVKFFKNIVPLAQNRGWLQMNFLTVGAERVAAYINFVYENRVLVYNSGLNHQEYGQLSPGIVLLAYNIQYAIEQGYQIYDFLRGGETYKYRMGGRDTAVMNLIAK